MKSKRINSHLDQIIKSKITFSAQSLNQKIVNRFDLIKQFNREFNQKCQRIKNTPNKRKSSSKKRKIQENKQIQSIQKKLFLNDQPTNYKEVLTKNYFQNSLPKKTKDKFESTSFSKQNIEPHTEQKYFNERKENIINKEKMFQMKTSIINFLNFPNEREIINLQHIFGNNIRSNAQKIVQTIMCNKKLSEIMTQIMQILRIDKIQDILPKIKNHITVDQFTFRLLELESENKNLTQSLQQYKGKVRHSPAKQSICSRHEMEKKARINDIERLNNINETLSQSFQTLSKENQLRKKQNELLKNSVQLWKYQLQLLKQDLNLLIDRKDYQIIEFKTNNKQIYQLNQQIIQAYRQMQQFQKEAEQNMQQVIKSNKQIELLSIKIMQLQKQTSNNKQEQLLIELANKNKSLIQQKNVLSRKIKQKENELQNNVQLNNYKQILFQLSKILSLNFQFQPCQLIQQTKQIVLQIRKMKKQLLNWEQQQKELCSQLQSLKNKNQKYSSQTTRLTTMVNDKNIQIEKIELERQQYKYLLQSVRDQLSRNMKQHREQINLLDKQHSINIKQMSKNKDAEYLTVHSQILEANEKLTSENFTLKNKMLEFTGTHQQLYDYRKRDIQMQQILQKKQKDIQEFKIDNKKLKQHLRQIQNSFREARESEQIFSQKIILLQDEKKSVSQQITDMHKKNIQLQRQNEEYRRKHSHMEMKMESSIHSISFLEQCRYSLDTQLKQTQMHALNKEQKLRKIQQENMQLSHKNKQLDNSVKKLQNEVNNLNKKIINIIAKQQHKDEMRKKILQKIQFFKYQFINFKKQIQKIIRAYQLILQNAKNKPLQINKFLKKQNNHLKAEKKFKQSQTQEIKKEAKNSQTIETELNLVAKKQKLFKMQRFQIYCIKQYSNKKQNNNNTFLQNFTQTTQKKISVKQEYVQTINLPKKYYFAETQQQIQFNSKSSQTLQIEIKETESLWKYISNDKAKKQQFQEIQIQQQKKLYKKIQKTINIQTQTESQYKIKDKEIFYQLKQYINQIKIAFKTIKQEIFKINIFKQQIKLQNIFLKFQQQEQNVNKKQKINNCPSYFKNLKSQQSEPDSQQSEIAVNQNSEQLKESNGSEVLQNKQPLSIRTKRLRLDLSQVGNKNIRTTNSPCSINLADLIGVKRDDFIEDQQQIIKIKKKLEELIQKNQILEERLEEARQQRNVLQKKNTQLQNDTSIKALQNIFKRLLSSILEENVILFQQTARLMMKLLHFEKEAIKQFQQSLQSKKIKKKGGFLANFFK